jgi:hypothetical protein
MPLVAPAPSSSFAPAVGFSFDFGITVAFQAASASTRAASPPAAIQDGQAPEVPMADASPLPSFASLVGSNTGFGFSAESQGTPASIWPLNANGEMAEERLFKLGDYQEAARNAAESVATARALLGGPEQGITEPTGPEPSLSEAKQEQQGTSEPNTVEQGTPEPSSSDPSLSVLGSPEPEEIASVVLENTHAALALPPSDAEEEDGELLFSLNFEIRLTVS